MTFISLACHWLLWTGNQYFLVRKKMEDLNILQWKFSSSSNRRKSLRLLGRRSNFMKNINNTQPPCSEGRRLKQTGKYDSRNYLQLNIRFGKVCSSSLCFLPGREPHFPFSILPLLSRKIIFTSLIIMSENISGHLSLHYFVSKWVASMVIYLTS